MAGRTFLVVDRASLDVALAEADARDKVVVAEGAFDAVPRLAVDGACWRLNGWTALPGNPGAGTTVASASGNYAGYVTTWAALARVFADTMGPPRRSSFIPVSRVSGYVVPDRPIISYLAAYAEWVRFRSASLDGTERPALSRDSW